MATILGYFGRSTGYVFLAGRQEKLLTAAEASPINGYLGYFS
jgi:hypothetical protein